MADDRIGFDQVFHHKGSGVYQIRMTTEFQHRTVEERVDKGAEFKLHQTVCGLTLADIRDKFKMFAFFGEGGTAHVNITDR